jgi:hypothetical protein
MSIVYLKIMSNLLILTKIYVIFKIFVDREILFNIAII